MRVQVEKKKKFLFTLEEEEEKTLLEKILFAEIIKKRERDLKKNIVFKFFSLLSLYFLLILYSFLAKKMNLTKYFRFFFIFEYFLLKFYSIKKKKIPLYIKSRCD
jgi:hypothetical protein